MTDVGHGGTHRGSRGSLTGVSEGLVDTRHTPTFELGIFVFRLCVIKA